MASSKSIKACDLPVMKAMCATCPFKLDKNNRMRDAALTAQVVQRTLFKAHQICHGTEGEKREWKNRCKGAFDYNMTIYKRLGLEKHIK